MLLISSTPGWFEAREQGRVVRDSALLGLTTDLAGFEVEEMILEKYLILRLIKSPLLYGYTPTPTQLATFLWILNPSFNSRAIGRKKFMRRCRNWTASEPIFKTVKALKKFEIKKDLAMKRMAKVLVACRDYVDETMIDKPKGKNGGDEPDYYSEGIFWCHMLGKEANQSWQDVMKMPMKVLFQWMNRIREDRGEKLSDAFIAPLIANRLKELNEQRS